MDGVLLFFLYLFYGLAFFIMGTSIVSRETGSTNLKIGKYLWFFALFAFTHALHEWASLMLITYSHSFPGPVILMFSQIRLALMFISYIFLLLFGICLLKNVFPEKGNLFYGLTILSFAGLGAALLWSPVSGALDFYLLADLRTRNLVGLPAALAAGIGLILYSRTVRSISEKGASSFAGAGISLILYGLLAGVIPSGNLIFVGIPVELLRGICALVILHFIMNALHIFDVERNAIIEDRLHRFAQSEKMSALGKLAAGIAHEVNNPLTNASLNLEMLRQELTTGNLPFPEKRLEAIERNVDRASRIAAELLQFSRNRETDFMSSDLNEIIQSTLSLLGPQRRNYQIRTEYGTLPPITAVPWKLEEVFLNLIINAMEASPKGSPIDVRTFSRGGKVLAELKDYGVGIPEKNRDSIFDPFFTTKEVGTGTGLGLSICYRIMEMHGGTIEVHSETGQGTVMTLAFPPEEETNDEADSGR